jgi:hypothetical protein
MIVTYAVVKTLSEGLVLVESEEFGKQLFTVRRARKTKRCEVCRKDIRTGEECWAEATSCKANRMHRVHTECLL